MTSLNDILGALPSLDRAERQRIVEAIKALDQFKVGHAKPKVDGAVPDEELILDALSQFLKDRGVEMSSPAMLRRNAGYRSFLERAPLMRPWLEALKLSRNQKRALLLMAMDTLYRQLAWGGAAMSAKHLLQNLHKLPAAVDAMFPGYARAGLLHLVVRERKQDVRQKSDQGSDGIQGR